MAGYSKNHSSILDAFVKYRGFKNSEIIAGNFFENNGIDIGSGNIFTPLMERSAAIRTFRQMRRTGISFNPYGENWGAHFGIFGANSFNYKNSITNANNDGESLSWRIHVSPINDQENKNFLHLGFNNTYRIITKDHDLATNSNRALRFISTGDAIMVDAIFLDTGKITDVKSYYQNMYEARYQNGALTITSEYITTTIQRLGKNLNFRGGYLMASYFLTGEKYGYDNKNGIQTAAEIGNKGVWEIASRYSMTDLNNGYIRGGKLNSYDFGVNYYPNNNLKFMVNYIFNQTDHFAKSRSNPQYLMARVQVIF
jgi:phosphate-selective porin OprO/OprP